MKFESIPTGDEASSEQKKSVDLNVVREGGLVENDASGKPIKNIRQFYNEADTVVREEVYNMNGKLMDASFLNENGEKIHNRINTEYQQRLERDDYDRKAVMQEAYRAGIDPAQALRELEKRGQTRFTRPDDPTTTGVPIKGASGDEWDETILKSPKQEDVSDDMV